MSVFVFDYHPLKSGQFDGRMSLLATLPCLNNFTVLLFGYEFDTWLNRFFLPLLFYFICLIFVSNVFHVFF